MSVSTSRADPEPLAPSSVEDVEEPDDRRLTGRRVTPRTSPLRPRLGPSRPHERLGVDQDGLPAPRQLPPARSVSLPLRSSLVRRRSVEPLPFGAFPVTPEACSSAVFGTSASSTNSASHSTTTSALPSPAMSRRSSSSGSSSAGKSVRWANLVMSVATHSSAAYDRAPWDARECDALAIPICKRNEEIDRWLRVEIDPKRGPASPRPASPPQQATPPLLLPSPSHELHHELSLANLALTETRPSPHLPSSSEDDGSDDPFAFESPISPDARWPHSSGSLFFDDAFGGF